MYFTKVSILTKQSDSALDLGINHDDFHTMMESIYLDWVNNYINIEAFAAEYGVTVENAKVLIEIGKAGTIWA